MPRTGLTAPEIKEKAIDATMAKMRKSGFGQVRMVEIAKELGLSHAALYIHFKDKTALLDAVSERWLRQIDESLAAVCRKKIDPLKKIEAWAITLHRAKIAKVLHDPELFKAFDLSTSVQKPFAKQHMEILHAQLLELVKAAIAKRRLRAADAEAEAEAMTKVLHESLIAFHHPKLVAQHIHERREPLLRLVLECVLRGLKLKS